VLQKLRYRFARKQPRHYKPVILITGCASGIGHALGRRLCACPEYRVMLTAREGPSLDRVRRDFAASETCATYPLDVTDDTSRRRAVEATIERFGAVDILINNAGISYRAVVEHMTEEDECRQMATNYFGPLGMIREVLPSMRERGRGKIINVSSVSGMLAMPTMASYSASKYALEGASEALWYELKPFGLNVTLVQPGFIHSRSFQNVYYSRASDPRNDEGPYSAYYRNMSPFVEKMMNLARATPEKIANQILKIIRTENPPLWVPATADAYAFYYLRRFLPRRFFLRLLFCCLPRARSWGQGFSHKRSRRAA
jgi:short-subunit dehydrogenase